MEVLRGRGRLVGKVGKIRNIFNIKEFVRNLKDYFFPGGKYFFKIIPMFYRGRGLGYVRLAQKFTFIEAYIELSFLMFLFSLIFSLKGTRLLLRFNSAK